MERLLALVTNPHVFVQFPHVITGAMATAAFFVLGRQRLAPAADARTTENREAFRARSASAASTPWWPPAVMVVGHTQAQYMMKVQPMKMAAAEALWETENPAAMSLFTWGDEPSAATSSPSRCPGLLSFLAYNRFDGEVKGIKDSRPSTRRSTAPATTCRR
jgi:cytochrome bd ubiquinol oxidase subunit I